MRHARSRILICLCTALLAALAVPPARSQTAPDQSPQKDSYATDFLNAVAGIPDWATGLEAKLAVIGNSIDQKKAKRALLPAVGSIQTQLSGLEYYNRTLVEQTSDKDIDRYAVYQTLDNLAGCIKSLDTAFGHLREATQAISIPELTKLERASEGLIGTKSVDLEKTIKELGYKQDSIGALDVSDLQERSQRLLDLLHKAQDSFGKLHEMLAS